MSKFIKTFDEITKKNVDIAGGKGASLGEMIRLRQDYGGQAKQLIPVPFGFVILADAFEKFLIAGDLNVVIASELDKINYNDVNSVDHASNVIRDLIHDSKIPDSLEKEICIYFKKLKSEFVAVRSSATAEDSSVASWAGELESYLNTTEKTLLKNVKKCWSSLFTPRAIFYRNEKKLLETKVSVAVVVQKMIQSTVSGICFTVHPVTKDKRQMIIEAGWGLGEAIVSGQITPDAYVIDKSKLENQDFILDKNIAEQKMMIIRGSNGIKKVTVPIAKQNKQKLTDKQILELAIVCKNIEKHYKKPQDIEWAFEKGKFYIVQSRPITTL